MKKCFAIGFLILISITFIMFKKPNIKNLFFAKFVKAKDLKNVSFGTLFVDQMFMMEWDEAKGWHNARIEDYKALTFDPSSVHMHYGQEIFEGLKAFKTKDNRYAIFRPLEHLMRFNRSANIMCMPEIDVQFVLDWIKELIKENVSWIPEEKGTSLYIRPTMIATEATINLKRSSKFLFFVILSPVGALYSSGFKPISILATDKYTRTSPGGVGEAKTGGNYAAAMRATEEAKKEGCAQVLWLDPVERKYVEEVGSMNIFFVSDEEIFTPALTGTILRGITRKSVITLAKKLGFNISEKKIAIDELVKSISSGKVKEIFGTGTAAVIAPIGSIKYKGKTFVVNNGQTGPITTKLYETLTGIQYGILPDDENWLNFIN